MSTPDKMEIQPYPGRLTESRKADAYRAGYWRDELAADQLAANAQRYPEHLAVVDHERRLSWRQLHQLSQRLALHLRQTGIRTGDAVALQLPNWWEYLVCYHAIQMAGARVIQIGADWREVETAYGLAFGPARAAIVPANFLDHDYQGMVLGLRGRLPCLEHVLVARGEPRQDTYSLDQWLTDPIEARQDPDVLESLRPGPDEVVRLVFTSGTTGLPKAIMHTNNTVAHSSRTLLAAFHHCPDDVSLQYVPLSTNYGTIMGLHLPLSAAMPVVLMDKFSASGGVALMAREKVTFVPGTPTGFIAFTKAPAQTDLPSLRLLMSAGSSFPVSAIRELRARFSATFIESYGMNEFGMGFWCSSEDDPDEIDGSIGRPIPGLTARIAGADGTRLSQGEIGELLIKSAGMCCGYHDNPDANDASWDTDGWFYSGDLAKVDEHGNYRIAGRSKDVIIRGGANVSPREVEEALSHHPAVREVTVIGLADAYYGEVVCACIVPIEGQTLSLTEACEYLAPKLARYKLPARIELFDALPLNSMGKVQKAVLGEWVLARS